MGEVIAFEEVQKSVISKYVALIGKHITKDLDKLSSISKNEDAIRFVETTLPQTKGLSPEIKLSVFLNALAIMEL